MNDSNRALHTVSSSAPQAYTWTHKENPSASLVILSSCSVHNFNMCQYCEALFSSLLFFSPLLVFPFLCFHHRWNWTAAARNENQACKGNINSGNHVTLLHDHLKQSTPQRVQLRRLRLTKSFLSSNPLLANAHSRFLAQSS